MNKKDKVRYKEYLDLSDDLRTELNNGSVLLFDGHGASPDGIAAACVFNEQGVYLRSSVTSNRTGMTTIEFKLKG